MNDQQLRVRKIENGTVIDHVPGGRALQLLGILGIDGSGGDTVSVGMNVASDRLGTKDIVKVEDRELSQAEVDVLSLIAPDATLSIVRDYAVVDKRRLDRPATVTGVLSCPNPDCITSGAEPVTPTFNVLEAGACCRYCETIVSAVSDHVRY